MATKRTGREVHLYVGTRKGGFLFRSDPKRKNWKVEGPFFDGSEVNHLTRDPRTGNLWAAVQSWWFGTDVQVSKNGGKKWDKASAGLAFPKERGWDLKRIWRVTPDREQRPETLWCGVDPGALFRTDNGGEEWYELQGLNQHPTRDRWAPGGGGLMVHHILPDRALPQRIGVAISAAGFFRSDDDGHSWTAMSKGVRTDFLPKKFPEVGQCVHSLAASPADPNWLFQQNHCGVYRSRDGGESWQDISKGLPSRFGFALAVHPHQPETIYVVPEIGPERRYVFDAELNVYRSRDGGKSWRKLTKGLPRKNTYTQVLRHGSSTDTCEDAGVYIGTTSGEIFYSRNSGDSWELLQAHFPTILSLHAAVV